MCDREDKTTNNNIYHGSIVKAFIECLEVELVVRLVSDTDGTDDAKLCRRSTSGQSGEHHQLTIEMLLLTHHNLWYIQYL